MVRVPKVTTKTQPIWPDKTLFAGVFADIPPTPDHATPQAADPAWNPLMDDYVSKTDTVEQTIQAQQANTRVLSIETFDETALFSGGKPFGPFRVVSPLGRGFDFRPTSSPSLVGRLYTTDAFSIFFSVEYVDIAGQGLAGNVIILFPDSTYNGISGHAGDLQFGDAPFGMSIVWMPPSGGKGGVTLSSPGSGGLQIADPGGSPGGVSLDLVYGDHVHPVSLAGALSKINNYAGALGTATTFSRGDHNHGMAKDVKTKAVNYVMTGADHTILADATGAARTITLPSAANVGQEVIIVKSDSSINAVTVQRAGSDTIEGATSLSLATQYKKTHLQAVGNNLWIDLGAGLV